MLKIQRSSDYWSLTVENNTVYVGISCAFVVSDVMRLVQM